MTVHPRCESVETSEGVPLFVTGVAQIKIGRENSSIEDVEKASEQFLGRSSREIAHLVLQTLEGHLRAILGNYQYLVTQSEARVGVHKVEELALIYSACMFKFKKNSPTCYRMRYAHIFVLCEIVMNFPCIASLCILIMSVCESTMLNIFHHGSEGVALISIYTYISFDYRYTNC